MYIVACTIPLPFASETNFFKVNIGDGGRGMNVVEVGQGGDNKGGR